MVLVILGSVHRYVVREQTVETLKEANMLASFAPDYILGGGETGTFSPADLQTDKSERVLLLDTDSRVVFDTNETSGQRGKIVSAPWILRAFDGENVTRETVENDLH